MDLVQAIYQRRSVRTFQVGGLDPELRVRVRSWIGEGVKTPFKTPVDLYLLESGKTEDGQKLGTYGTIKGAELFLAGVVAEATPGALADFAFAFETMLLKLTTLGIGSCWLGAAFKRNQFADLMEVSEDQIIPAVSPVGFPAQKPRLREALTLKIMNARQRKPAAELFFDETIQKPLVLEEANRLPFELVRLGPSALNRQPWRIVSEKGSFHFYRYGRSKPGNGGTVDLPSLDMGIAMCHFDIGARALGWQGQWRVEDPLPPTLPSAMEYCFSYVKI